MSVQQEKFKEIADRVRHYLGISDLIKPNDFAAKIDDVAVQVATTNLECGYNQGVAEQQETVNGFLADFDEIKEMVNLTAGTFIESDTPTSDYAEKIRERIEFENSMGVSIGVEQGKQAQYDAFWDVYQAKGNRSDYGRAFAGLGWADAVFAPKYDMNVGYGYQMFLGNKNITDLKAILERCNVTLNLTKGYELFGLFQACTALTHLPALTIPNSSGLSTTFYQCYALKTIDCLYLPNGGTFDRTFYQCNVLEDIVIEGVIGNNIDFRYSPLNKKSIMGKPITSEEYESLSDAVKRDNVIVIDGVYYYGGIITALKSDATGKTLTLKKTAVNSAFGIDVDDATTYPEGSEYYILRHSKDNWNISYV